MNNRRIELLNLDSLLVDNLDGGYQRQLDIKRVKKAVDTFDISLIDTPLIAKRVNGDLYIVDGNHTVNILLQTGIKTFQCNVMDSKGREDEAPVFVKTNEPKTGGVNVKPYERYIAGIASNLPVYIEIRDLMLDVGVEITRSRNLSNKKTNAIGTLQDMILKNRKNHNISKSTKFIRRTWPNDDYCWSADILRGCTDFISRLNDEQIEISYKRLKNKSCSDISNRASSVAMALGKHKRNCIADVLMSFSKLN